MPVACLDGAATSDRIMLMKGSSARQCRTRCQLAGKKVIFVSPFVIALPAGADAASWHLDCVMVVPRQVSSSDGSSSAAAPLYFACHRWLDRHNGYRAELMPSVCNPQPEGVQGGLGGQRGGYRLPACCYGREALRHGGSLSACLPPACWKHRALAALCTAALRTQVVGREAAQMQCTVSGLLLQRLFPSPTAAGGCVHLQPARLRH